MRSFRSTPLFPVSSSWANTAAIGPMCVAWRAGPPVAGRSRSRGALILEVNTTRRSRAAWPCASPRSTIHRSATPGISGRSSLRWSEDGARGTGVSSLQGALRTGASAIEAWSRNPCSSRTPGRGPNTIGSRSGARAGSDGVGRCRGMPGYRDSDRTHVALRVIVVLAVMALALDRTAAAETLPGVLAKAYQNNPQLNAQRAYVRQTGEQVNIA